MSDNEDFPRPRLPTPEEEALLERCVSYEQYRELEDAFRSFKELMTIKHNELVDHLVANGVSTRLLEKKVTAE